VTAKRKEVVVKRAILKEKGAIAPSSPSRVRLSILPSDPNSSL